MTLLRNGFLHSPGYTYFIELMEVYIGLIYIVHNRQTLNIFQSTYPLK